MAPLSNGICHHSQLQTHHRHWKQCRRMLLSAKKKCGPFPTSCHSSYICIYIFIYFINIYRKNYCISLLHRFDGNTCSTLIPHMTAFHRHLAHNRTLTTMMMMMWNGHWPTKKNIDKDSSIVSNANRSNRLICTFNLALTLQKKRFDRP